MTETDPSQATLVGINHVALAVGDVDTAESLYESLFEFEVRGRTDSAIFLDMGDQFLVLAAEADAGQERDDHRHIGLVVDDADAVERRLDELDDERRPEGEFGVERLQTSGLEFRDPWGNRIQIVEYSEIQFTKAEHVLEGMGLSHLEKSESALAELAEKGMAPE